MGGHSARIPPLLSCEKCVLYGKDSNNVGLHHQLGVQLQIKSRRFSISEVVATFPQLHLYANNWKAEAVVTARYSSGAQTYLKDSKDPEKCQVKSEEGSSSIEPNAKHFKLDPTADGNATLPASPESDTNSAPVESFVAPPPLSKPSKPILKKFQVETPPPEKLPTVKNPL